MKYNAALVLIEKWYKPSTDTTTAVTLAIFSIGEASEIRKMFDETKKKEKINIYSLIDETVYEEDDYGKEIEMITVERMEEIQEALTETNEKSVTKLKAATRLARALIFNGATNMELAFAIYGL